MFSLQQRYSPYMAIKLTETGSVPKTQNQTRHSLACYSSAGQWHLLGGRLIRVCSPHMHVGFFPLLLYQQVLLHLYSSNTLRPHSSLLLKVK